MFSEEKLFGNFFKNHDGHNIINRRFYDFSRDSYNKLTAANGAGDYTALIALIEPLIVTFGTEIGDVDVAITIRLGKTLTTDQVLAAFGLTMKEKEGVIANALGGFNTPAYLEFYPSGFGEYRKALKSQMPNLTLRVKTAATTHNVALGAPLTALLQGYQALWQTARDAQEVQKGVVDDNRTERTQARIALELGMLTVVHTIAAKFPGDVDACNNFFAFNMLFPHGHKSTQKFAGSLAASASAVVVNRTLTDAMKVSLQNPDDNADLLFALVHENIDQAPPAWAVRVKPQKSKQVKPSELGDIANATFLKTWNASDVNEGAYFVKITGMDVEGQPLAN